MRLNKWITGIGLLVLCNACIEPFRPEVDESSGVMVIDGKITDAPVAQSITVSRSSPYNDPQFLPVEGCVVRVEDGSGNGVTFIESDKGVYQSDLEPGFIGIGKAYKLLVITPEGETYESDYDSLLACAPIESLSYEAVEIGTSDPNINTYGIRFYADMIGSPGYSRNYMWTFEETWEYLSYYPLQYIWDGQVLQDFTPKVYGIKVCYMNNPLENFEVGSSGLLEKNEIRHQYLHFVSNQTPRLQEKYALLVIQHSLSDDAFLYWDRVRTQSSSGGGLYESQPASTRGNIYNISDPDEKVLGYFFASQTREKRIFVDEDFDFPIARFYCPQDTARNLEDFGGDYPIFAYSLSMMGRGPPFAHSLRECHDCRYRGGVTLKPDYWDQ